MALLKHLEVLGTYEPNHNCTYNIVPQDGYNWVISTVMTCVHRYPEPPSRTLSQQMVRMMPGRGCRGCQIIGSGGEEEAERKR